MVDQDFIVADFSFDKRIYWKHYQHFMWKKKDDFISGCVCVVWMAFGHDRSSLGQDLFNTSDQWLLAFVGVNGKIEGISSDDESKMKKQRFSGVRGLCVVNKRTFFFLMIYANYQKARWPHHTEPFRLRSFAPSSKTENRLANQSKQPSKRMAHFL